MKLRYAGRQGTCRYYWRIFRDNWKALYYKVDGLVGPPNPVGGSPLFGPNYVIGFSESLNLTEKP